MLVAETVGLAKVKNTRSTVRIGTRSSHTLVFLQTLVDSCQICSSFWSLRTGRLVAGICVGDLDRNTVKPCKTRNFMQLSSPTFDWNASLLIWKSAQWHSASSRASFPWTSRPEDEKARCHVTAMKHLQRVLHGAPPACLALAKQSAVFRWWGWDRTSNSWELSAEIEVLTSPCSQYILLGPT